MPNKLDYLATIYPLQKTKPHASYYPVITNIAVSLTGIVTWTTDVASSSQVLYGTNIYLGQISDYDSSLVTSHSVQLTNLTPSAVYYFKVQSFNIDSLSISDMNSFVAPGVLVLEDGVNYILLEDGTKIRLE